MTAPPITLGSFGGNAFPPEVSQFIVNKGIEGAPFGNALSRYPTVRSSIVFPTADPSGFDWVRELDPIPGVDLGDDSTVAVPSKLGGIVTTSNESVNDASFPLADQIGQVVARSMGTKADDGLLYGSGTAPQPDGVYDQLTNVTGATLREAAVTGASEIMGQGGNPDTLFLTAAAWATEMNREGANGPIYAGSQPSILNLRLVVVPALKTGNAIVADTSRCYLVVRQDYRVDFSRDGGTAFTTDATLIRVLARLAAVIPNAGGAARSITVATTP